MEPTTTTQEVAIVQENGTGTFHVHASECADLNSKRYHGEYVTRTTDLAAEIADRIDMIGYAEKCKVLPCTGNASALRKIIAIAQGEV